MRCFFSKINIREQGEQLPESTERHQVDLLSTFNLSPASMCFGDHAHKGLSSITADAVVTVIDDAAFVSKANSKPMCISIRFSALGSRLYLHPNVVSTRTED